MGRVRTYDPASIGSQLSRHIACICSFEEEGDHAAEAIVANPPGQKPPPVSHGGPEGGSDTEGMGSQAAETVELRDQVDDNELLQTFEIFVLRSGSPNA